jgi:hypothetical protein
MRRAGLLSSELCRPLINSIQLEVSRVNAGSGVDDQRKLKFFPSLCEGPDELKEPPFPDGPRKDFNKDLSPGTRSGNKKLESGVCSPEIRVASVCALLDVSRDSLAKLLHSSLNRLTVGRDLLRIGHIF